MKRTLLPDNTTKEYLVVPGDSGVAPGPAKDEGVRS